MLRRRLGLALQWVGLAALPAMGAAALAGFGEAPFAWYFYAGIAGLFGGVLKQAQMDPPRRFPGNYERSEGNNPTGDAGR